MTGEIMTPLQMLERLVAFDTVSAHSNMALIEFVQAYLAGHGIEGRIGRSPSGEKANLVASVGPAVPGGVILSGHTDVVPVAGQPWTNDPFKLVARNGSVVGRGAADMKGFIAVALALVPEFMARGLKRPIHFALSYDEEVGCLGAPLLLSDLVAGMPRPGLAIIGEPTMMQLVNRHKGFAGHETLVTGRDGHSSRTHRGVNAVMAAGEIIGFLSGLAAEFREQGPFDDGFDPPYTSINVGTIEGGTALNIIARQCRFGWEFRQVPQLDGTSVRRRLDAFVDRDLLPRLRRVAPEAAVATKPVCTVPALVPAEDSPAETLVRQLTGANRAGAVAFGTEAGLFQQAGIPSVVCGPGSIEQAHQPDEFIAVEQIEACTAFLRRLADWAA